jgi:hypothetical protein
MSDINVWTAARIRKPARIGLRWPDRCKASTASDAVPMRPTARAVSSEPAVIGAIWDGCGSLEVTRRPSRRWPGLCSNPCYGAVPGIRGVITVFLSVGRSACREGLADRSASCLRDHGHGRRSRARAAFTAIADAPGAPGRASHFVSWNGCLASGGTGDDWRHRRYASARSWRGPASAGFRQLNGNGELNDLPQASERTIMICLFVGSRRVP